MSVKARDAEVAAIIGVMRPALLRAVKLAAKRPRRAKNADRDFWVALDRDTRTGASAKQVADAWSGLGLTPALVDTIASRMRRRAEFQQVLRDVDVDALRRLVQWQRERLTHLDGWRQHLEALRLLQLTRST